MRFAFLFFWCKTYTFIGDLMFEKIREYIKDEEFRLVLFRDRVYITNYSEIITLNEKKISINNGDKLELSNVYSSLEKGQFILKDLTTGKDIPLSLFATDTQKKTLLSGGRLNEIKGN